MLTIVISSSTVTLPSSSQSPTHGTVGVSVGGISVADGVADAVSVLLGVPD
jgi:hypothetical protein